jgi:acyl-CoA reductase-like NAD-dependent aldehyde dehydrogenase
MTTSATLPHYIGGERVSASAALADIIYEVGVPAGVFNMVLGGGRSGEAIVKHPGVDGIGGTRRSSHGPREQGFAAVEFYTQVKTAYVWG